MKLPKGHRPAYMSDALFKYVQALENHDITIPFLQQQKSGIPTPSIIHEADFALYNYRRTTHLPTYKKLVFADAEPDWDTEVELVLHYLFSDRVPPRIKHIKTAMIHLLVQEAFCTDEFVLHVYKKTKYKSVYNNIHILYCEALLNMVKDDIGEIIYHPEKVDRIIAKRDKLFGKEVPSQLRLHSSPFNF